MKLRLQTTEPPARATVPRLAGVQRHSCAWRDAIGPGFAVGISEKAARALATPYAASYSVTCRR